MRTRTQGSSVTRGIVAAALAIGSTAVALGVAGTGGADTVTSTTCAAFGTLGSTGTVTSATITEASGVVASRRNPGVFWTHNDNRGENRLFALDASGRLLGTVTLTGAAVLNPEDVAIGTGPLGGDYLYFGDIGDNDATRADVKVLRFPEPDVALLRGGDLAITAAGYETFSLKYQKPGTPGTTWSRNAEAMAIDPVTGRLYVFEKEYVWIGGPRMAWVYSVDTAALSAAAPNLLVPQVAVKSNIFTPDTAGFSGADISADGRLVMVKNRLDVFSWLREPGETVEQALARAPQSVCPGTTGVGEAIGILGDSSGYVMLREGLNSPMWRVTMTVPTPSWTCGGLVPNLMGTGGNDVIHGTPGRDVIVGRPGNDIIDGGGGDDLICGNAGNDLLYGNDGHDIVHGNVGDDFDAGGEGNDRLFGETGVNTYDPGPGDNRITDGGGA